MTPIRHNLTILVVGNIEHLFADTDDLTEIANTVFCGITDLTLAFLETHQPEVILSPLVDSNFDVIDLAIKLDQMNYLGRVRAITPPLPDPKMILREIRFECPALDFDFIMLRPNQKLRSV